MEGRKVVGAYFGCSSIARCGSLVVESDRPYLALSPCQELSRFSGFCVCPSSTPAFPEQHWCPCTSPIPKGPSHSLNFLSSKVLQLHSTRMSKPVALSISWHDPEWLYFWRLEVSDDILSIQLVCGLISYNYSLIILRTLLSHNLLAIFWFLPPC